MRSGTLAKRRNLTLRPVGQLEKLGVCLPSDMVWMSDFFPRRREECGDLELDVPLPKATRALRLITVQRLAIVYC